MNIGIDIDDTITETYKTLIPMIAVSYDLDLNKLLKQTPSYRTLHKSLMNYDKFITNNFTTMAKIVPLKRDVVEVLNQLKSEGNRIIFITARNRIEYDDPYKLSKDYLDSHNIPYDKLIADCHDKGKQCVLEGIDLFIDDNTMNCKAVAKKGVPVIQFAAPFTKPSKGLQRANNWKEIYYIVKQMRA